MNLLMKKNIYFTNYLKIVNEEIRYLKNKEFLHQI